MERPVSLAGDAAASHCSKSIFNGFVQECFLQQLADQ